MEPRLIRVRVVLENGGLFVVDCVRLNFVESRTRHNDILYIITCVVPNGSGVHGDRMIAV